MPPPEPPVSPEQALILPATYAKREILSFLKSFFTQGRNQFIWSNIEDEGTIFIADKHNYNREQAERRPGLVTNRGRFGWSGRHIDQHRGNTHLGGERIYLDFVQIPITINAISTQGLEAEELAQAAWLAIMLYKDMLRSQKRTLNLLSTTVGEEVRLRGTGEKPDLYVVPVGTVAQVHMQWTVRDLSAKLVEKVDLRVTDPPKPLQKT